MAKKKKNFKENHFVVMDSIEATEAQMPKYNGFMIGHGPHGNYGYNRRRAKEDLRKEMFESM